MIYQVYDLDKKITDSIEAVIFWWAIRGIPLLGEMSVRTKGLRRANGRTVGESS